MYRLQIRQSSGSGSTHHSTSHPNSSHWIDPGKRKGVPFSHTTSFLQIGNLIELSSFQHHKHQQSSVEQLRQSFAGIPSHQLAKIDLLVKTSVDFAQLHHNVGRGPESTAILCNSPTIWDYNLPTYYSRGIWQLWVKKSCRSCLVSSLCFLMIRTKKDSKIAQNTEQVNLNPCFDLFLLLQSAQVWNLAWATASLHIFVLATLQLFVSSIPSRTTPLLIGTLARQAWPSQWCERECVTLPQNTSRWVGIVFDGCGSVCG